MLRRNSKVRDVPPLLSQENVKCCALEVCPPTRLGSGKSEHSRGPHVRMQDTVPGTEGCVATPRSACTSGSEGWRVSMMRLLVSEVTFSMHACQCMRVQSQCRVDGVGCRSSRHVTEVRFDIVLWRRM